MQIKVIDTKMHKIASQCDYVKEQRSPFELVPVAEAKLVLVEDKLGRFIMINDRLVKPILISETEKIGKGDWARHTNKDIGEVVLVNQDDGTYEMKLPDGEINGGLSIVNGKKILALSEHFSPKHLQAIVDSKMKDGDKVLVECIDNTYIHQGSGKYHDDEPVRMKKYLDLPEQYIKLSSSNHITLYKIEEKMYSEEQVKATLKKFATYIDKDKVQSPSIYRQISDQWFELNK